MFTSPPRVPLPLPRQALSWIPAPPSLRLPPLAWALPPRGGHGINYGGHSPNGDNPARGETIPTSERRGGDKSKRLRVVQIRGDGRCLFRAIARGIAHAEGRQLSESLERQDADALRGMAWKAMCVDRRKEFQSRNIVEGSLSAYCSQMRNPTFFGGEAEMFALSDALKIPIAVYLQDQRGQLNNIMTYGEKYSRLRKADMTVRVLYNGTNHYNAVLPSSN